MQTCFGICYITWSILLNVYGIRMRKQTIVRDYKANIKQDNVGNNISAGLVLLDIEKVIDWVE